MGELSDKIGSVFDALNRRIADLEQALDWYAQPENYEEQKEYVVIPGGESGVETQPSKVVSDGGKRARKTLKRGKKSG